MGIGELIFSSRYSNIRIFKLVLNFYENSFSLRMAKKKKKMIIKIYVRNENSCIYTFLKRASLQESSIESDPKGVTYKN